ncbi:hypothetical protein EXIGLDRAFT_733351 [Exidia glandulosa HHB12029]|uniref:histidine kinase n=1 Tax=Exidia glandulosa HHB12029 TaxID=1314781 RepID=A0A165KJJ9_EXIGL|nr:hypothetical protein EXIGLDRAFT_733351 [Exidia glandulosa HHB12029]
MDSKDYPLTPMSKASGSAGTSYSLPAPALASPKAPSPRIQFRRTRISLHRAWSAFKQRVGTASSAVDSVTLDSGLGLGHGSERDAPLEHIAVGPRSDAERVADLAALPDDAEVDYIVVDRDFADSWTPSEHAPQSSPEKSQDKSHPTRSDTHSIDFVYTFWHRVWALVTHFFFFMHDFDDRTERNYQREAWNTDKLVGFVSSLFLIVNWVLGVIILSRPLQIAEKAFYYGVAPTLSLSVPAMIAYDFPRKFPIIYQVWLAVSVWSWCLYQVLFINLCSFYGNRGSSPILHCEGKDFLGLLYYACALPTIAVFALRHHRFTAAISAVCFIAIISVLVTPYKHTWIRSTLNLVAYYSFLLFMHYKREENERRLYLLREELKTQMLATQQAQQSERKTSDSKRRLTSYIFHEVRVPLNTAMLAAQNMEASNSIDSSLSIEFVALQGSLSMMSKVLNDVLDFNRMDAGRFESVSSPYAFHTALRSMFVPVSLAAETRGLELVIDLDKNVDLAARKALYEARGESPESIAARLRMDADEDALVVGDEMRLRQVVTNLASNATKFTPAGGRITIATKLLHPSPQSQLCTDGGVSSSLSHTSPPNIVVRIEVTDTGLGIKPRDLRDHKLFSPYVQTDVGKLQGGKGSGLGLALVRHIVKLSGGRLGVQSRAGQGSCFWVELPLGVGQRVLALGAPWSMLAEQDQPSSRPPLTSGASNGTAKVVGFADPPPLSFDAPPRGGFRAAEAEGITPSSVRTGDKSMFSMTSSNTGEGSPSISQSINGQAATAYRSIMEQGGKVDMLPGRTDDDGQFSRAMEDSILVQSASGGTLAAISTAALSSTSASPTPAHFRRSSTPSASDNGHGQQAYSQPQPHTRAARPTFVSIPSRGSFSSINNLITVSAQHSPAIGTSIQPFTTLNARNGSTSSVSDGNTRDSLSQFAGLRVLVVDDDMMNRMLMGRMLTRLGCMVHTAENGQAALDMLFAPLATPSTASTHEHGVLMMDGGGSAPATPVTEDPLTPRFHLVLLDNQMPIMNGLQVISRLRDAGRTDLVIGVTGNALLADQEEYLAAGVDEVLTKPVMEKDIKAKLVQALQRARASSRPPG